jgi:cytidylate kinase
MAKSVGLETLGEASLVWAAMTVPTEGKDGHFRIGATGETTVALTYVDLFKGSQLIGFGAALRQLCSGELEIDHPTEVQFEAWRNSLAVQGTFALDRQVDQQLQALAVEEAIGLSPAVVASKLIGYIWKGSPEFIALGVQVVDDVATQRMWQRNVTSDPRVTTDSISRRRAERYEAERENFLACYGIEYSPESVKQVVDYIFDNTPNRTPEELRTEALLVLQRAVDDSLSLAASLFTYAGVVNAIPELHQQVVKRVNHEVRLGDVLDLLRIRFQRIVSNAETTDENLIIAWQAYAAWNQLWKELDDYKILRFPERNSGIHTFVRAFDGNASISQQVLNGILREFSDAVKGNRAYSGGIGFILRSLPEEKLAPAIGFCDAMKNFAKKHLVNG